MYTLVSPSQIRFTSNLALIGHLVSEKKIFEYYGDIHEYCQRRRSLNIMVIYMNIAPGWGGPAPRVHFFQNHKSSVHLSISFKFFPSNDILTIDNFTLSNAQTTYVDLAVK